MTEMPGFDFTGINPTEPAPAEPETVELEPFREFEFDLATSRLRVAGYTPGEAADLLALYREHMREMQEIALAAQRAGH
jgi:hypothetical protein